MASSPFTTSRNEIADALAQRGWYVGPSFFSAALTRRLCERAQDLRQAGSLRSAAVGHHSTRAIDKRTRGDETRWLSDVPEDASEQEALVSLHDLRAVLNESLFLGAQTLEAHFAHYAPGTVYQTHRDAFRDDDARVVSFVIYLNPIWADGDGGELVLYADDDSAEVVTRVLPRAGTMVCFLSEKFPHEVLPASRARFSLSGWLRRTKIVPQRQ